MPLLFLVAFFFTGEDEFEGASGEAEVGGDSFFEVAAIWVFEALALVAEEFDADGAVLQFKPFQDNVTLALL